MMNLELISAALNRSNDVSHAIHFYDINYILTILKNGQRERYESCWDFTWTDRKLGESTGGMPRRVVDCNAQNDITMSCGMND